MNDIKSIHFPPPVADGMVRAILDGRKTVTRRVVKPQPKDWSDDLIIHSIGGGYITATWLPNEDLVDLNLPCRPGDILYVGETWCYESHMEDMTEGEPDLPSGAYSRRYIFKADCPDYPVNVGVGQHGWHPSMSAPFENVDFRRNGVSFLTGQHTGVIQP